MTDHLSGRKPRSIAREEPLGLSFSEEQDRGIKWQEVVEPKRPSSTPNLMPLRADNAKVKPILSHSQKNV